MDTVSFFLTFFFSGGCLYLSFTHTHARIHTDPSSHSPFYGPSNTHTHTIHTHDPSKTHTHTHTHTYTHTVRSNTYSWSRHTHSVSPPVSWADSGPWCSWEIASMPGPTKTSFQPPACLTSPRSPLGFVPRNPSLTRGHPERKGVKSRCLCLISPRLGYPPNLP